MCAKKIKEIEFEDFGKYAYACLDLLDENAYDYILIDGQKHPQKYCLVEFERVRQRLAQEGRKIDDLSEAIQSLIKIKDFIPFFKHMNYDDVLDIVDDVRFVKYAANEVVFEQNELGEHLFFILEGNITLSGYDTRKPVKTYKFLKHLKKGMLLGEIAPLTSHPRTVRAKTNEHTVMLAFKINQNSHNTEALRCLYMALLDILADKVVETNNQLFEFSRDIV